MASNSVSGSTSFSASASRGMSGLVSGLDTESMVDKMLGGTQNKIDKATGNKQQLIWKQDAYRSVITQLLGFQSKFFDLLSPKTNILSTSFFNSVKSSSLSKSIKVTATNAASAGDITIDKVLEMASARKEESVERVSGGLVGVLDAAKVTADGASFDVTLEGTTKTITLEKGLSQADMTKSIQDQINQGFGKGNINVTVAADGIMKIETMSGGVADPGRKVTVSAFKGEAADATFLKEGQSNKLNLNTTLQHAGFKESLSGSEYVFKINGVEIKTNSKDSVSGVMSKINSSNAGVKVTYSPETDKFSIESKDTGAGRDITFEQTEGNLLTAMFGVGSAGAITSEAVGKNLAEIKGTPVASADVTKMFTEGGKFSFKIDGVEKEITIKPNAEFGKGTAEENKKQLEEAVTALSAQFQFMTGNAKSGITLDADGAFTVKTGGEDLEFVGGDPLTDLNQVLGIGGKKSKYTNDSNLNEFGIKGTLAGVTIAADDTMTTYAAKLQAEMQKLDPKAAVTVGEGGKLTIKSEKQMYFNGDADLMQKFFGTTTEITLNSAGASDSQMVVNEGTNAKIIVNGITTERSSNTFELSGVSVEILAKSDEPIKITTTKDTEQVFNGVKAFVEDYNSMIDKLNELIHADTEYREYPPLTDAQKKDMSEKEIEKWNEKAQTGLLRGDEIIGSLLGDMRTAMYAKPADGKLSIYDLGIQTSDKLEDYGKLVIEDEGKLRQMIDTNSAEVEKLFTSEQGGISTTFNKLIDNVAKKSSASPGTLVSLAGISKTASENENMLSRDIKDYDERLKTLKQRYETEKARYWKQFNAMEQMISNMNQQSSWLTQQMG